MSEKKNYREMLMVLLEEDRLDERERSAFTDMFTKLDTGVYVSLTKPQAMYVDDFYKKFDLASKEGSQNLWSSGKVPVGFKMPKRDFETMAKPCPECRRLVKCPGPQHASKCSYHSDEAK